MSVDLVLRSAGKSGPLSSSRLEAALQSRRDPGGPRAAMRGQTVRLALRLDLDDAACAAFTLDFAKQGARVTGSTRGPSASLLYWCFHALAAELGCALFDPQQGETVTPAPQAHRADAIAYLEAHEREIEQDRAEAAGADDDDDPGVAEAAASARGAELLAWLEREGHLALAEDASELAERLPLDDLEALYEMLIDADEVDEVFVSETELGVLLARFRARGAR